jgi:hypothetical protein
LLAVIKVFTARNNERHAAKNKEELKKEQEATKKRLKAYPRVERADKKKVESA